MKPLRSIYKEHQTAAAVFVFCLLAAAMYARVLGSEFVFDDQLTIVENQSIRDIKNLSFIWRDFNTRFLTGVSFALNYYFGGTVAGYHIVNIAIHTVVTFWVYLLVLLTFRTPLLKNHFLSGKSGEIAFWTALVFLCHPIQTQAVTYITQRASSLAAFWYLGALVLYIKSRLDTRVLYRQLALLCVILGMFTKENTFTIPLMLSVYEFFFFRGTTERALVRIKRLIPFFLTLLIIPLILAADKTNSSYRLREQMSLAQFYPQNFYTEINVLRTYLRLLIFPFNQNLDYDYPKAGQFWELPTVFSAGLILLLWAAAFKLFRKFPLGSFCVLWFFLTISVEVGACSLIGNDMIFEHYLYLPMVGFSLLCASTVFSLVNEKRKARVICVVWVGVLAILTFQRNRVWENGITLWTDVVRKSPNKARPYNNLGNYYSFKGENDKAIDLYKKALLIDSQYTHPYNNLGYAYLQKNNFSAASRYYEQFIEMDDPKPLTYLNLGLALSQRNDFDQAVGFYRKALEMDPRMAQTYVNLGAVYGRQGDYTKEISYMKKALEIDRFHPQAYGNLCLAYAQLGEYSQAIQYGQFAVRLDPKNDQLFNNLGLAYGKSGDLAAAIRYFEESLRLNPKNSDARGNLNLAVKMGQSPR